MTRHYFLVLAVSGCLLLAPAIPAFGQCSKDTDCKGNRICVKGACVDAAPSNTTPPSAATQSENSPAAPSESEVTACVATLDDLGRLYGAVLRVEYGTPMTSQGGMTEMKLGAPSGTRIFPVRLRFHNFRTGEAWMYRDPFGSLKCIRHGDVEHRPPTTLEEMKAAIKDGETVTRPVKMMLNSSEFATGTLSISTATVGLRMGSSTLDFSLPPDQIYNVDSQNWQLHLHLLVYNARYHDNSLRQDVYLWDPAVRPGPRGVDCSGCGDAVSTLEALVRVARGK